MADFTNEVRGTSFDDVIKATDPIKQAEQRRNTLTDLYKTNIADPVTRRLENTLHFATSFLPGVHSADKPGPFSKFIAGMFPQTPAQLMIDVAAPGLSKVGEKAFAASGPITKALKGGALRTGLLSGTGALTSAATGENPLKGGTEGLVAGIGSEILRGIGRRTARDITPDTPEGRVRLEKRLAEPVDLTRPQPDNWTRTIVEELPALQGHVTKWGDLANLNSVVAGNHIVESSKFAKQIGKEIYNPFHGMLNAIAPHVTFSFPYLRPGRFGRLSLLNIPTISELLPNVDEKILRRAGNLTPNEALDIIQQLKDAAFNPAKEGAIADAAKKFAVMMENDFKASLNRIHPLLTPTYENALLNYRKLKDLQILVSKHYENMFPGGGTSAGLNPALAKKAIEATPQIDRMEWPMLHDVVSFHMGPGAGATMFPPQGATRVSAEGPSKFMRFFAKLLPSYPKIEIHHPTPLPQSRLQRVFPPMVVSGAENVFRKEE